MVTRNSQGYVSHHLFLVYELGNPPQFGAITFAIKVAGTGDGILRFKEEPYYPIGSHLPGRIKTAVRLHNLTAAPAI